MPEAYDERGYTRGDRYVVRRDNSGGWFALLLIPLAFLAGWVANGYYNNGKNVPGLQTGVGGGPANVTASPTPQGGQIMVSPTETPIIIPSDTPMISPTTAPMPTY